ncbi:MAG: histidine kinase, partial [Lachnospiraceae bacterium]|nr:histidine kinase [Lachnospiraceae bacterium]
PDRRGISLIRAINSEKDYKRIAMLLININESTIREFFDEVGARYGSSYCIVNKKNEFIVQPSDSGEEMINIMSQAVSVIPELTNGYHIEKIEQNKYCIVRQELGVEDWYLVGILPISQQLPMGSFSRSLIALIIVLNIIVIAICSMVLVRLVFRPISEIEQYMSFVEKAEFLPIPVEEKGNNEIIHLKRGFNSMVGAISGLLEKVKEEEKSIARGELELLQAQINPHFLYNTLDAISALTLTQDYESCFKMTQSLGQFYRNSLNSGKQLVTVEDEINCVKNYITILNIRYDNKINLVCEIQQDILQQQILKLVLQPVVENAVYHGIRGKECEGTILIRGYSCEDEIILSVSDDGVGMTEEKIQEILSGNSQKDKSGFGLYSAIQRISLFYEMENPVTITSEIGSGTEIMICLRLFKED